MRYFARDISTVGTIFLVDNRRINVDKCQVLLRQRADGRGNWGADSTLCEFSYFLIFNFITYLHTSTLLPVTSEHNNLPNTTYAHFFCSPLPLYPRVRREPTLCTHCRIQTAKIGSIWTRFLLFGRLCSQRQHGHISIPCRTAYFEGQFRATKKLSSSTLWIHDWAMRLVKAGIKGAAFQGLYFSVITSDRVE